jgi:hypothetical protein
MRHGASDGQNCESVPDDELLDELLLELLLDEELLEELLDDELLEELLDELLEDVVPPPQAHNASPTASTKQLPRNIFRVRIMWIPVLIE